MKAIQIRQVRIGESVPKICVPITGGTMEEIIVQAKSIVDAGVDLVEWRCDYYQDVDYDDCVLECLEVLRGILKDTVLLFTFRTKYEGGQRTISQRRYIELNILAAGSGFVDLVDVEVMRGEIDTRYLIEEIHAYDVYVIASNHDFFATPKRQELAQIFLRMDKLGADILKIATMPKNARDILVLLAATQDAKKFHRPIVTMAMGHKGIVTRMAGEIFGSAITFGCLGKASAPGQIELSQLKMLLDMYHEETAIDTFREILYKKGAFPYNIFMTGFMGTGKSAVSRFLMEYLPLDEFDMDATIVKNEGKSINDIFAEEGEPYFRSLETGLLVDLQKKDHLLVACGGGAVLREENVTEMKKSGVIVLLTATPETILERVSRNDDRPLLRGNKNIPFIEKMLNERGPKYKAAADVIVSTDAKTIEQVAIEVCEKLCQLEVKDI